MSLFLSLSLSLSISLYLLSRCSLTRELVAEPRQIQRILRPSVLGTLFRANSSRTRGARDTERKRCLAQSLRGTFASSTKYLRQSSRPYHAALYTHARFTPADIFLSSTKIFQDVLCDHRMLPCIAASSSVSREGFTLSKRNRRQSRCPPSAACLHDSFSSHGQSLRSNTSASRDYL